MTEYLQHRLKEIQDCSHSANIKLKNSGFATWTNVQLVATKKMGLMALKAINSNNMASLQEFVNSAANLAYEADSLLQLDHSYIAELQGVSLIILLSACFQESNGTRYLFSYTC